MMRGGSVVCSNGPLMNEWTRLMKSSGRESLRRNVRPIAIDEPTIKLDSVINVYLFFFVMCTSNRI